ncbi:hypothetical protein J4218_02615 [Candidatus Pacearchaeota archaeon]|nr:hypothetical protein [Candidatus Pacearchaeota archaeon]
MKTRYFTTKIPINNHDLYDMFENWIKPEEITEVMGTPASMMDEGVAFSKEYSEGHTYVGIDYNNNDALIRISGNRVRNINRVASKLSRLLRLNEFGGLMETDKEIKTAA